ncbi:MAG: aryl-sulfate sulfotransferase [Candidatus Marinimicrobia bacterium]|nr:aryl-sulfate sulfotransferase [Candidatus Neomarinimicrobiota bacterium]
MQKFIVYILFIFLLPSALFGEGFPGLVIFSQSQGQGPSKTVLLNNFEQKVKIWNHDESAIGVPHLNTDGSIILQLKSSDHYFGNTHGPVGGVFKKLDYNGDIKWSFDFYNENYHPHHDFEILPNGNILTIGWEKKSFSEGINAGRINIENEIWPLVIHEIRPPFNRDIEIIWKWHLWDHLIQDQDSTLNNYGIIKNHPELININIGEFTSLSEGDWLHTNAIAYNEQLDQIIISSRHLSEIFIIDHSTTIEQASEHTGGNSNKGGDILYRWGNPINYGRGTIDDQKLNAQHGAHWIPQYFPGSGNIIMFNNNPSDATGTNNQFGNSSVVELVPPIDVGGNYIISDSLAFGPIDYEWEYGGDNTFFSHFQSGAYRLLNGNTIITSTQEKNIFEIDSLGNKVWEYDLELSDIQSGYTARAKKYGINYLDNIMGDIYIDNQIDIYDFLMALEIFILGEYLQKIDFNNDSQIDQTDIDYMIGRILNLLMETN